MVGEETSDEERAELRETLGLTDPIYVQFTKIFEPKPKRKIPNNNLSKILNFPL